MTDPTQVSELRDAPLAQAVCEYITTHPKEWNQSSWGYKDSHCGSTACIAGTAGLLAGEFFYNEHGGLSSPTGTTSWAISNTASDLLGLRDHELFYWDPTTRYDENLDQDVETNLNDHQLIKALWYRVAEEYPEGSIVIPEEYK